LINNRQNGRRRGRGGNGGGNGQRGGNPGRPDSGNRIDSRARGNANQLYEKYKNLARDAQMSGDRVNTEYYLQFADHYFRVLSESRARFEEQNPNAAPQRRIQPVDSFDDFDGDEEYGDEGEPIRSGEQGGAAQQANGHRDVGRENGRDGNRDRGRDQQRFQAQREDGRRDDVRRDEGPREDGQRRHDGVSRAQGGERLGDESSDRYAVTGSPVANDLGEDSPDGAEPTPIAPRRRGRPRREPSHEATSGTEAAPAAFDADRLPPSLSLANAPVETGGEAEEPAKPRRRRTRAASGEASPAG
jgi:hypothetical protein